VNGAVKSAWGRTGPPPPGRRRGAWGRLLLALLILPAGCERGASPAQQPRRPSVILISMDTTRADHLGCYGHPTVRTPHIDRLAAEGVRFEQCLTCVPVTLPSHSSILTGVYPYVHKVRDNGRFRLAPENVTLAEVLHDAGYATFAQVGAFVLHHQYGLDQGFDAYRDVAYAGTNAANAVGETEIPAAQVTDGAIELLQRAGGRPYFLFVHYFDPHRPYRAPQRFTSKYLDPYLAEIAYTDEQIGRLLDAAAKLGALDDTLVVLTADHGEGLGQHHEDTHGYFLYDATLRVPLIFRWPGKLRGGAVVSQTVRTIDIAPTILALLDAGPLPHGQGRDLSPAMRPGPEAPDLPPADAYAETFYPKYTYHLGFSQLRALHSGPWKYILAPRDELYNLGDDPRELRNLAAEKPDLCQTMRARLRALLAAAPRVVSAQAAQHEVGARELRALEALGYLGGGDDAKPLPAADDELALFEPVGLNPIDHVEEIRLATQAVDSIEAGQHAKTERTLKALLEQAGDRADEFVWAHAHLAGALAAQGKFDEALVHFDQAIAARPDDGQMYTMKGIVLRALHRNDEAIAAFREALRHPPVFALTHLNLGRALIEKKEWAAAAAQFRLAIEKDPQNLPAHVSLARIQMRLGRREQAARTLTRAAELARKAGKKRKARQLENMRRQLQP